MLKPLQISAALLMIATSAQAQLLSINVQTQTSEGSIRAAIFEGQSAFDTDKAVTFAVAQSQAGGTKLTFPALTKGTYGIALFQDKNGNETLDRNLLGAPKEPFGFSNNPKIGFSAPKFDAFKFEFDGDDMALNITLNGS